MQNLIALLGTTEIRWIIILIMIDTVLGIIAALIKKDFRLGKLAKFMAKPVLGYVFGFAVLGLAVNQALPKLDWIIQVAFVLIVLSLFGSIFHNLTRIGLKLPDFLLRE